MTLIVSFSTAVGTLSADINVGKVINCYQLDIRMLAGVTRVKSSELKFDFRSVAQWSVLNREE